MSTSDRSVRTALIPGQQPCAQGLTAIRVLCSHHELASAAGTNCCFATACCRASWLAWTVTSRLEKGEVNACAAQCPGRLRFVGLLDDPESPAHKLVLVHKIALPLFPFNGTAAKFKVASDTYLTATVPNGATTGSVTVKTPGGTLTSNKQFRVTPVILSFSPTSGPVGTPVTITGTSFTGATKVTFGGVKATVFSVDKDTQITATVPTGAKTGKITVTTPGGTATSKNVFTVTQ